MPQAQITIRRAVCADVPAIVRLLANDPLGSQREDCSDPLPEGYYTAFEELERSPHEELVVVELSGEVVGTLQLTFLRSLTYQGRKRAQVEAVNVAERCRGQGIGRRLLEWAIQRARQEGCFMVQLTSHKTRTRPHHFYAERGFVASHEGMKLYL